METSRLRIRTNPSSAFASVIMTLQLLQHEGRAIALVDGFSPRRSGFEPSSRHVGFVVEKLALVHVFSEYFDFPCQFSFHRLTLLYLLHIHHYLSSGAGIIGQLVADVQSGLSLTPLQKLFLK
jgi:hypothetical protein